VNTVGRSPGLVIASQRIAPSDGALILPLPLLEDLVGRLDGFRRVVVAIDRGNLRQCERRIVDRAQRVLVLQGRQLEHQAYPITSGDRVSSLVSVSPA
jgi:hypothetical protein